MGEARQLGVSVAAHAPGASGFWGLFTAASPARGAHFQMLCNHAMHRGLELVFVVEGEHAEEAAGRVRRLTEKPLDAGQVEEKARWHLGWREAPPAPKERYERAEIAATLPGCNGLECTVYQYFAAATMRLRERVYVTVSAEGEEFRPEGPVEHFPHGELFRYQMEAGRAAGAGEEAFGKGRELVATFTCYAPPRSGAAEEAVSEIRGALEKLREVASWPDGKRSWFALRRGLGGATAALAEGLGPAYRPPKGVLAYRPHAPKPGPRAENVPKPPPRPSFSETVRGHLERWGVAEEWDRMQAERPKKPAARRTRRVRPVPPEMEPWESWRAETRRWDEEYRRGSMWT